MKRKHQWKKLSPQQEQKIVDDFNHRMHRTQILLKHKIPEGQFIDIIKKTNK